jgi:hypothetical protein
MMGDRKPRRGFLHFDWLCPGHVTLIFGPMGGEMQSSTFSQYLTVCEAEVIGQRLLKWAQYQRAKTQGLPHRQPDNSYVLSQVPNHFPDAADQLLAMKRS